MTTKKSIDNLDNLILLYHDNRLVRYGVIIIGGIIVVYVTAKAFKGAATLLRSYNDMKLAYHGQ